MKLLDLKTMRGPNYWSGYWHNIIVARLDIEELENSPTNKLKDFPERLAALMPSLKEHHCSEGHEGGFFERVKEGTWMAHVIEHIALELQWQADMPCSFGRTRSTDEKGVYTVAFSYEVPKAGYFAIESAIEIVKALVAGVPYNVQDDIAYLKRLKSKFGLGVSTQAIITEARKKNIPVRRMDNDSFVILGYGANQRRIKASMTCATSGISMDIASDKQHTKEFLDRMYIPVPQGKVVSDPADLTNAIAHLGFPIVIKPIDGNHGRGITTNIQNEAQAQIALKKAQEISEDVIAEHFIDGEDYRFLLVNHKLIAVAKRTPAFVTGDGKSTVKELIDELNSDPLRGEGHDKPLTILKIDESTLALLQEKQMTLETVLPLAERLYIKRTANLSSGGTSTDVTDKVHPDTVFLAQRISTLMNLDICGIDVIIKNIQLPLTAENGAVIEVNACPGLRMHLQPSQGVGRNVAEPIIEMLFPNGKPSRIPIVAITGTNGKTTTTRLIAHIARVAGQSVGYTTTDGVYVNKKMICAGDCTGASSAETILADPAVNFAVLECARGGILRSGLGFDYCDISIVTNVSDDHLGLDGIRTVEEMARVKSVVAESTFKKGYTILNAEDDHAYDIRNNVKCKIALFALDPENSRLKAHREKGGLAATVENGYLAIYQDEWLLPICKITDIPLSMGGTADCMIKNILAAALAAFIRKFTVENIREALFSFVPSPEFMPGRFNIFDFSGVKLMVDYAHNPKAMIELGNFLRKTASTKKIGIITAVGDRMDADIMQVGAVAAAVFDEIIIRHDKDLRGRTGEDMTELLTTGIRSVNSTIPVTVVPDEKEAIRYALVVAQTGSFITVLTESPKDTLDFVLKEKAKVNSDKVN
jgi:cyanophycin synthetase